MRVVASFGGSWGPAVGVDVSARGQIPPAQHAPRALRAAWSFGKPCQQESRAPWVPAATASRESRAPWHRFASRLQAQSTQPWVIAGRADQPARAPWGRFTGRPALTGMGFWLVSQVADKQNAGPWGQYAGRPALALRPSWSVASRADAERWIPWVRFGRPLDAGWGVVTPPGEPPLDPNGTLVVPIRQVYIMINEATLTRVDDSTALPVLSLSASTDADSWAWRVDATLPATSLDAVMPGMDGAPVLLQASINGHPVRWVAESVSRDRVFGKERIKVSGRSPSAMLADPFAAAYSYTSVDAITAQQAAINAITEAGLPLDWSIGWHITDWLLPAGLWQHHGTPLSAVQRIAEAAGAYVQTDALLKTLHIRHRYPTAPWGWPALTPDVVMPTAHVMREGVEWTDKPAYNEVYVSGQSVGVLGHIIKAGTTGGLAAGTVVDDLITHADAARQRGRAILGDTGRQQRISLSLPISDDSGLLSVGQLIDIAEGTGPATTTRRGLVRSVAATYAAPSARQTIEVECHG